MSYAGPNHSIHPSDEASAEGVEGEGEDAASEAASVKKDGDADGGNDAAAEPKEKGGESEKPAKEAKDAKKTDKKKKKKKTIKVTKTKMVTERKKAKLDVLSSYRVRHFIFAEEGSRYKVAMIS